MATLYVNGQYYGKTGSEGDAIEAMLMFGGRDEQQPMSGYYGPQGLYNKALTATEATAIHQQLLNLVHFDNTSLYVTVPTDASNANVSGKYILQEGNIADGTAVWKNSNNYYLYNLSKNSDYDSAWVIATSLDIWDSYEADFYSSKLFGSYYSNWDEYQANVQWYTGQDNAPSEPEVNPDESSVSSELDESSISSELNEPSDPEVNPDEPSGEGTPEDLVVTECGITDWNGLYKIQNPGAT